MSMLKLRKCKNGSCVIRLFQDVNNDGRIFRKELICNGLGIVRLEGDCLADFKG